MSEIYAPGEDKTGDTPVMFKSGMRLTLTAGHVTGWINVYRSVK